MESSATTQTKRSKRSTPLDFTLPPGKAQYLRTVSRAFETSRGIVDNYWLRTLATRFNFKISLKERRLMHYWLIAAGLPHWPDCRESKYLALCFALTCPPCIAESVVLLD